MAHNAKPSLDDVRKSPIAGAWYPGTHKELQETIDGYLAQAEYYSTDDELIALISPHAGYPYSGQTAAYAFCQLKGLAFDNVIVLGPSHYDDFGAAAVSKKKYYSTPLGTMKLDRDFIDALDSRVPLMHVAHDREHSLEIQLPFLQRMLGDFNLVPIMMSLPFYLVGADALEPCEKLASALADLSRSKRVLLVASSDLSHLRDYNAVKKYDARLAELVEAFDVQQLVEYMWRDHECRACGDAPIITLLLASQKLGADRAHVIYRTNSGDVTGDHTPGQYTVGYMAAGVYRSRH